jgi:hypothetical protein
MEDTKTESVNINRVKYMVNVNKNDISNIKGSIKGKDYDKFIAQLTNLADIAKSENSQVRSKSDTLSLAMKYETPKVQKIMNFKMPTLDKLVSRKNTSNNVSIIRQTPLKSQCK